MRFAAADSEPMSSQVAYLYSQVTFFAKSEPLVALKIPAQVHDRKLAAVQFVRFMESGRTSPALFGCEDESGRMIGEYVVKLRGTVSQAGLVKEMFASGLASHFGLVSPEPALIGIERNLADLITRMFPTHAAVIAASVGLNFGTRALTGVSTWPVDKSLPFAMFQTLEHLCV